MNKESGVLEVRQHLNASMLSRLHANVASVFRGKDDVIRLALVSMLARGHVLIEDIPGVGKTTLARALARSLGVELQRIQFTSDLLPADIIGVSVFDHETREFHFHRGPIFSNIVLADEINRATPKTQSALLEAMSEGKVSVERSRMPLPLPFLVLATQNPLEHQGTFPLPESQLDRFLLLLEIGYPEAEDELELLQSGGVDDLLDRLEPVLSGDELVRLQAEVPGVVVSEKLARYMLDIANATRDDAELAIGLSTRGLQGVYRATQALAFYSGRDYATPDDVRELALAAIAHRVVPKRQSPGSRLARDIVERIVESVPVPI